MIHLLLALLFLGAAPLMLFLGVLLVLFVMGWLSAL